MPPYLRRQPITVGIRVSLDQFEDQQCIQGAIRGARPHCNLAASSLTLTNSQRSMHASITNPFRSDNENRDPSMSSR
jgi:hypothetical protein